MRQTLTLLILWLVSGTMQAQDAVIEESLTEVTCLSPTHYISHFRESTTLLNERAASMAFFSCSCSKNNKLNSFKGLVTDATGRILRKMKQGELLRTEYSSYLAIDDYKMYFDYTPPVYPVTITYEWTIESSDNLIEFPPFVPVSDYDVSVKKASYLLTAPKDIPVSYALKNISATVKESESEKGNRTYSLELSDLPAIASEPFAQPLRERLPIAYFKPKTFSYFGTKGSLDNWETYGQWEYSLIDGTQSLPEDVCRELRQHTDTLPTQRAKVEALFQRLAQTTRYVAILLGIGGQRPAPAQQVCRNGFGDCKGLSNYMRAMLEVIGIPSHYTTISTQNRRLLPDFASVGQMNHVVLEVPLPGDTLWLECTAPNLPMGYVHGDIEGHDAIEISEKGGRLVSLPVCPDSLNMLHTNVQLSLDTNGAANIHLTQEACNRQYESYRPLLTMDTKDRHKTIQRLLRIPQAEIGEIAVSEQQGATLRLETKVRSEKYSSVSGQRLFVPVCPVHGGYSVPRAVADRKEDIYIGTGYLDEDEILMSLPEGYAVESAPKDIAIEQPFGSFSSSIKIEGRELKVNNRLLMRSGTYDKMLYPQLTDFFKTVSKAYAQKIVFSHQ